MTSSETQAILTLWAKLTPQPDEEAPSYENFKQLSEACRTAVALIQHYERLIPEQRIRGAIRNLRETQDFLTALVTP